MPFTTMNNYNWLFDVNGIPRDMQAPLSGESLQNRAYKPLSSPRLYNASLNGNFNGNHYRAPLTEEMLVNSGLAMPLQNAAFLEQQSSQVQMISERQHPGANMSIMETSISGSSPELSLDNDSSPGNFSSQYCPTTAAQTSISEYQPSIRQQSVSNRAELASAVDPARTFGSSLHIKRLPTMDDVSRNKIVDLIEQAATKTPEGSPINRNNPLLSLSAMQNYLDLFFSRFNVTYPLLHRATFNPSQVETLLLLSVLLLGATYGDKAGHKLAVCIHDILRAQIFQSTAFKAQPDLWILQTILLVECFGKSRAGQAQHDMAHLFHGLLIK